MSIAANLMTDPDKLSAQAAVAVAALINANRAMAMIEKLKKARDLIEGANVTEAERVARYSALDEEARPILAKVGIVWHSHIGVRLARKIIKA